MALSKSSVARGESLHISSSGWKARSSVRIELHSSPVLLGTFMTDGAGTLSATVTIPKDTAPGRHTIVAYGADPSGKAASVSASIEVTGATSGDLRPSNLKLPRTGAEIAMAGLIGLGLAGAGTMAVAAGRRRRRVV
jgi:LPXTG-motif cell wall-anchored protein